MKKMTLLLAIIISITTLGGNAFAALENELAPTAIGEQISYPEIIKNEDTYMDRYAAINIYDWDGVTKLSSLVAPKGMGISEILPSLPKPGYIHVGWTTLLNEDGKKNIATPNPIRGTNKNPYDGEIYDVYAPLLGSVDLIPIYDEGEIATNAVGMRYMVSHSPLEIDPLTKDFVTTVTVERPENAPRIHGDVKLQIAFNTKGAGTTRVYIPLGNKDIETYRLIVPTNINVNFATNAISLTVVDANIANKSLAHNIKNTEGPGN